MEKQMPNKDKDMFLTEDLQYPNMSQHCTVGFSNKEVIHSNTSDTLKYVQGFLDFQQWQWKASQVRAWRPVGQLWT